MLSFTEFFQLLQEKSDGSTWSPNWKVRDYQDHFYKNGWSVARRESSHIVHKHPKSSRALSLPVDNRGTLAPGTGHKLYKLATQFDLAH